MAGERRDDAGRPGLAERCRVEGCQARRLGSSDLCAEHLNERLRLEREARERVRDRAGNWASWTAPEPTLAELSGKAKSPDVAERAREREELFALRAEAARRVDEELGKIPWPALLGGLSPRALAKQVEKALLALPPEREMEAHRFVIGLIEGRGSDRAWRAQAIERLDVAVREPARLLAEALERLRPLGGARGGAAGEGASREGAARGPVAGSEAGAEGAAQPSTSQEAAAPASQAPERPRAADRAPAAPSAGGGARSQPSIQPSVAAGGKAAEDGAAARAAAKDAPGAAPATGERPSPGGGRTGRAQVASQKEVATSAPAAAPATGADGRSTGGPPAAPREPSAAGGATIAAGPGASATAGPGTSSDAVTGAGVDPGKGAGASAGASAGSGAGGGAPSSEDLAAAARSLAQDAIGLARARIADALASGGAVDQAHDRIRSALEEGGSVDQARETARRAMGAAAGAAREAAERAARASEEGLRAGMDGAVREGGLFDPARLLAAASEAAAGFVSSVSSALRPSLLSILSGGRLDARSARRAAEGAADAARRLADALRRRVAGRYETDAYGVDQDVTALVEPLLGVLYCRYFRVEARGLSSIPARGPALIVANRSSALPWDALMIAQAIREEHHAPRDARPLALDWLAGVPVAGEWLRKSGLLVARAENGDRLLAAGELVIVFPEGERALSKPRGERYRVQRFSRDDLIAPALERGVPVIPCAVVGGEEASPTLLRLDALGRLLDTPGLPGIVLPIPLPTKWHIRFGAPIHTAPRRMPAPEDGPASVDEARERTRQLAAEARDAVQTILDRLRAERGGVFF